MSSLLSSKIALISWKLDDDDTRRTVYGEFIYSGMAKHG